MIIEKIKYVNATKSFPLMFDWADSDGEDTDELEEAYFYDSETDAKIDLDRFDEPESRQILPIKITYEL